jgi:L,D-transpeptidase YcbB
MTRTTGYILGGFALLAAATPAAAQPRGDEPIAVPRTIKQGIDFVYVDPQMASVAQRRQRPQNWLARMFDFGADSRNRGGPNPLFYDLGRGLQQYQASWGRLPQIDIPAGAALKRGAKGKRVELLRTRLGLAPGGGYDETLLQRVTNYRRTASPGGRPSPRSTAAPFIMRSASPSTSSAPTGCRRPAPSTAM